MVFSGWGLSFGICRAGPEMEGPSAALSLVLAVYLKAKLGRIRRKLVASLGRKEEV